MAVLERTAARNSMIMVCSQVVADGGGINPECLDILAGAGLEPAYRELLERG